MADDGTGAILKAQQAQFVSNFILQTRQSMIDNQNTTQTAIMQSHSQATAGMTAGARQVGDANSHIVA